MIGFIVLTHSARNYKWNNDIADLRSLQFAVTHTLGFSVFTSRILATDLYQFHCNYNTYKVFKSNDNVQLIRFYLFSIIFNCRLKRLLQFWFQLTWDPRYIASGRSQRKHCFHRAWDRRYVASGRSQRKHCFHRYPNNTSVVACLLVAAGTCLQRRCLAMNMYSGSTLLAFRRHVTILRTTRWRCFKTLWLCMINRVQWEFILVEPMCRSV
jgi:hypothetical protein